VRIRYENTIEDLIAWNKHYVNSKPGTKGARAILLLGPAIIVILAGSLVCFLEGAEGQSFGYFFAIMLGVSVGFAALMAKNLPRLPERTVRNSYRNSKNKGIFGIQELEFDAASITKSNDYVQTTTRLEAIEKVERPESHTFIYMSANTAHIIPHAAVFEGNLEAFVAALQEARAKCDEAVRPTSDTRFQESLKDNRYRQ
jgi:hypothetical protein